MSSTVVMGTGIVSLDLASAGWSAGSDVLAALAGLMWLVLVFTGEVWSELAGVSATALAARLADVTGDGWLRVLASGLLGAGVVLYVAIIARFDRRELRRGHGAQWIAGGALAISALAAADIGVDPVDVGLAVAALAWLPVVLAGELAAPRAGDPRTRWSTIFPVGMYAAMAFAVGFGGFAHLWAWVALAVWALAAAYAVSRPCSRRTRSPAR